MKIIATPVKAKELLPGDLFSNAPQLYWDNAPKQNEGAIGEKVYIRTHAPTPEDQADDTVQHIHIHYEECPNCAGAGCEVCDGRGHG